MDPRVGIRGKPSIAGFLGIAPENREGGPITFPHPYNPRMRLAVLSSKRLTVSHAFAIGSALALLPACKPKTATSSPATEPGSARGNDPSSSGSDGTSPDGTPAAADPDAPPDCAEQGEPWDGRQDTCLYEHHGCCYPDPASLCAAAGCTDDNCSILESHPAQAACG